MTTEVAKEMALMSKKTHKEWSVPRARLKDKGIIDVETRGMISMNLPRFKEFVENQIAQGNV